MGMQQDISRELAMDQPVPENLHHLKHFPKEFHEIFHDALEYFASKYLVRFLRDKQMYGGGSISRSFITSPVVRSIVLNTSVSTGVVTAYEALDRAGFTEKKDHNQISNQMRYVLATLEECSSLGIPKCLSGGLLMLHLHCCEGVPVFE